MPASIRFRWPSEHARRSGADIAVGDAQPFGIPLSYGGPYAGFIACQESLVRRLPGRIVGASVDTRGRRAYVMTLRAREQDIRREKATSNICSNHALCATTATIYLSYMGKQGLRHVANLCLQKAHYAADQIGRIAGYRAGVSTAPFFHEFVVRTPVPGAAFATPWSRAASSPGSRSTDRPASGTDCSCAARKRTAKTISTPWSGLWMRCAHDDRSTAPRQDTQATAPARPAPPRQPQTARWSSRRCSSFPPPAGPPSPFRPATCPSSRSRR